MDILIRAAPEYSVIDVETTELTPAEIPQTKFWGFADSKGYERFEKSKELARFLKHAKPKILLHHSNFDIIMMLKDGITDFKILRSHNGKLIRCQWNQHTLQNTLTAFPVSLAKIFSAFGYKKSSLKNLDKRNYEDCVNGLDCFLQLNDLFFNLVGVHPLHVGTVAGTTFKAAEMIAGKMPKDLRFESAYRGGRVEVFSLNRQTCSKFDIHSSYPASFLDAPETDELWHIEVQTRDWHCPFFDAKEQTMLAFPNGHFLSYTFKSNWEKYIELYAQKTRIKILSRHKMDFRWLKKLTDLINTLYAKKANDKNPAIVLCCKFLLNAFYGRIGLRGQTERARILDYIPDKDDVTYYSIAPGKWLVFDTVERDTRSNYPYASFITDNARARLFRAFKRNHPIYGDTDSIFTPVGRNEFAEKQGNNCGNWNFEGRKIFCARNVKDYEWDGEQCVKGGIPGKEFLVFTLKSFLQGKNVEAITRQRVTELRKRRVLPNGETEPHVVNNT